LELKQLEGMLHCKLFITFFAKSSLLSLDDYTWFVTMTHLWASKMKPSTSSLGSTSPFEIHFIWASGLASLVLSLILSHFHLGGLPLLFCDELQKPITP
jgi:hypothetical protein